MSIRRSVLTLFALAGFAGSALAQTSSTTVTRGTSLPPIGLASSETAQINVANLASNSSSGTAASCTGTISFLNASGTAIGTATSFTVTSGQTFSASLPYAKTAASGRTVIRGVVTLTESTSSYTPCDLALSLETYDTSTGVTHVYVTSGAGGGGPGGGPGFGH